MLDPIPEQNFPKGPFIGLYSAQESKESSARQFSPSSFRTTTKFHIVDACHLRWTAHVRSRQEPKVIGLRLNLLPGFARSHSCRSTIMCRIVTLIFNCSSFPGSYAVLQFGHFPSAAVPK